MSAPGEAHGPVARSVLRLTSRPTLTVLVVAYWALSLAVLAGYYAELPAAPVDAAGRVRHGDFLAFYVGARAVHTGEPLYDVPTQRAIQEALTGPGYEGRHPFVYPASFAALLAPLAALPYRPAFLVFNGVNLAVGLGAALLLGSVLPRLRSGGPLLLLFAAAGFPPLMRTWVAGGQTTVLALFCLALATWGLARERPLICGLGLGLLGFKPQLLLPLLLLLGLWREGRALAVAGGMGLLHWAAGAWAEGPAWPLEMLSFLADYQAFERGANYHTHVSLLSACEHTLPGPLARPIALVLVAAALGWLVRLGLRAERRRERLLAWAAGIAAALLISPHTQYYDVALLAAPALLVLEDEPSPPWRARAALLVGYFAYPVYEYGAALGFQPLLAWPIAVALWSASRAAGRGGGAAEPPAVSPPGGEGSRCDDAAAIPGHPQGS